jgi:tetratricopeptide (TPR) repeat protein
VRKQKGSLMNRHLKVALLALGSIICVTGGKDLQKGANVETTGNPAQITAFVSAFPRPSTESPRDSEEILEGDTLRAKQCNDRGIIYSKRGEYDLAILEFNKALEINPLAAETYNNLGITYSKKGQNDLAVADFTKALEIKPDMAEAHYNRGLLYARNGRYNLVFCHKNNIHKY